MTEGSFNFLPLVLIVLITTVIAFFLLLRLSGGRAMTEGRVSSPGNVSMLSRFRYTVLLSILSSIGYFFGWYILDCRGIAELPTLMVFPLGEPALTNIGYIISTLEYTLWGLLFDFVRARSKRLMPLAYLFVVVSHIAMIGLAAGSE